MHRPLRTALAIALATLALILTGCGSADPSTQVLEAGEITPADLEVGDEITVGGLANQIAGALREAGTMRMSRADGLPAQVRFTSVGMDFRADDPDARMVYVDGVMYLEATGELADLAGGKAWIRIDPADQDLLSQMLAPVLQSLSRTADPTAALGDPTKTSTVVAVDGDHTTFETLVTGEEVLAAAREVYGQDFEPSEDDVFGDYTFTHVVDGSWLPVSMTSVTEGQEAVMIHYSGFGDPVDIVAPPEDQVGSFTDGATTP